MNKVLISSMCMLTLWSMGCSRSTPTGTPSNAPSIIGDTKSSSGIDLSIPRFAPKPVVWIEDWEGEDEPAEARQKAQEYASIGDQLKSRQRYIEADRQYELATLADPSWGYPPYQRACNFELSNQPARSVTEFQKAIDLGFDDFPTVLGDDELGTIRNRPDFNQNLMRIRERYVASGQSHVGTPIAVRPLSEKPDGGWPMMLLLHGYGDTNINYLGQAEDWSESGFVTVAVPGSVPAGGDHFQWPMESTVQTNADLQAIIQSPLFDGLVNREKVFLLGFSQGALHAMLLTAEKPDLYAGVVGLSPGGSLADQLGTPDLKPSKRPVRCAFIHGTAEPHAPFVQIWQKASQSAGWKFQSHTHPGGHQFPKNWAEMQPQIANFLISGN